MRTTHKGRTHGKILEGQRVRETPLLLDVHKQFLPLGEVGLQAALDIGRLHVPQALVLQPHLHTQDRESQLHRGHEWLVTKFSSIISSRGAEGTLGIRIFLLVSYTEIVNE